MRSPLVVGRALRSPFYGQRGMAAVMVCVCVCVLCKRERHTGTYAESALSKAKG